MKPKLYNLLKRDVYLEAARKAAKWFVLDQEYVIASYNINKGHNIVFNLESDGKGLFKLCRYVFKPVDAKPVLTAYDESSTSTDEEYARITLTLLYLGHVSDWKTCLKGYNYNNEKPKRKKKRKVFEEEYVSDY